MGVVFTRDSKWSLCVRDVFVIRAGAPPELASPDIVNEVLGGDTREIYKYLNFHEMDSISLR